MERKVHQAKPHLPTRRVPRLCALPENIVDPGVDPSRFDVAFWRRYERMLRVAREIDIVVEVIFYADG